MPKPNQTPAWQPISQLPTIAWAITGMLKAAQEQLHALRHAEARPHVLDTATVERVIRVYTQQHADLGLYTEQLARWQADAQRVDQRRELARLEQHLTVLRETLEAILALAQRVKAGTIDVILAQSDAEVGLNAVLGRHPKPDQERE